jgi:CheY-like chemotaxis protein
MPSTFADQRVLVAEDDYVVAQQIAHELRERGARIIGPASTPDAALQLACEHRLDAAVLDINLRGGAVYPVADLLSRKGVPFLFATAYDLRAIPERYAEVRVYDKAAAQVLTLAEALSLELEPKLQSMGSASRYSVRQAGPAPVSALVSALEAEEHSPGLKPSYTLHRIIWSDGRPSLDPEDYSVQEGGQSVGRIYRTSSGFGPAGYVWSIYGQPNHGFAPTLDEAKAEWQAAYERKPRYDLS